MSKLECDDGELTFILTAVNEELRRIESIPVKHLTMEKVAFYEGQLKDLKIFRDKVCAAQLEKYKRMLK